MIKINNHCNEVDRLAGWRGQQEMKPIKGRIGMVAQTTRYWCYFGFVVALAVSNVSCKSWRQERQTLAIDQDDRDQKDKTQTLISLNSIVCSKVLFDHEPLGMVIERLNSLVGNRGVASN